MRSPDRSDHVRRRQFPRGVLAACLLLAAVRPCAGTGDCKTDSGYSRLVSELGAGMPSGTNITVSHIEGVENASLTNYMPDKTLWEFAGKTIVNRTPKSTNVSSHATMVGQRFYGSFSALATNITYVDVYEVNHWLTNGFLRWIYTTLEPLAETNSIQSHAWANHSVITSIVRRLDYAIDRDGFLAVVGLANGSGTTIPPLLACTYNGLVVGRNDGDHSRGTTPIDTPGRVKPDMVAQAGLVSEAVPTTASAAAVLLDAAATNPALSAAASPEAVKALLLAGATKRRFPSWNRTSARPLDSVYGAGELNIYNSYRVLAAGEQDSSNTNLVKCTGWDSGSVSATSTSRYFFAVPASNVLSDFSVALEWRRHLTDGDPGALFAPVPTLANLNLKLSSSSNFITGAMVDLSTSAVDNVEYIYRPSLAEGEYAMEVTGDTNDNYALAWFGKLMTVPEITGGITSNDAFLVSVNVTTGHAYIAEASTNLFNTNGWTAFSTNVIYSLPFSFTNGGATNHPRSFYRLVPE